MSLFVKVCGVRDLKTALACASAGADAVGFVFDRSVRRVDVHTAENIATCVPELEPVAVFRRQPSDLLEVFKPRLVQADHPASAATLPVFREAPGVEQLIDTYMLRHANGVFVYEGPVSGSGRTVCWARAAAIARKGRMILAGGLRPENVASAVKTVRPFGVDVSSGVERRPGVKDPARIREFVAAARSAAKRS